MYWLPNTVKPDHDFKERERERENKETRSLRKFRSVKSRVNRIVRNAKKEREKKRQKKEPVSFERCSEHFAIVAISRGWYNRRVAMLRGFYADDIACKREREREKESIRYS